MGNALRFLSELCQPNTSSPPDASKPQYLGPHGVTSATVGVSALAQDILNFDSTSQVPDRLSHYVVSSKKAQVNWYRKLSDAWKNAKPPPRSPEAAAMFVILTLKRHQKADVQGLLQFYGLPYLVNIDTTDGNDVPSSLPQGVRYQFNTLAVNNPRDVADGDTITVYVDIADPRESSIVPREVVEATVQRARARAAKDYERADANLKAIADAGYRVLKIGPNNEEILTHKYRIRLRGIDAPENSMPYGKEAKEELLKLVHGKCLTILVYEEDRYGRTVGDIYCNDGVFVQEVMLKRGCAWHYTAYDKRPEFAEWEKSARAARRGLWAAKNPEKPWDYRRDRRNGN